MHHFAGLSTFCGHVMSNILPSWLVSFSRGASERFFSFSEQCLELGMEKIAEEVVRKS
jgi:hypothetical protein